MALAEYADQPKLKDHLADLKAQWSIKNPEHEAAREMIYTQWSKAEVTDIDSFFDEARQAFETLKGVDDRLTAKKLLLVNTEHALALSELVQQLATRSEEADRDETEKFKQLSDKMASFTEEVGEYATGQ